MKTILMNMMIVLGLVGLTAGVTGVVSPASVFADTKAEICKGIGATGADCATADAQDSVNNIVETIINIFSWVVGVISVIMIIVGGFKYITSGGESGKITSAKNTIVYALIGLIIVALAQVIVIFVLDTATATP